MTICEKNSTELFQPASKSRCGRFTMRRQKSFEIMNDDSVFEDEAGPLLTSIRMREHAENTTVDTVTIRDPASNLYSITVENSRPSKSLPASKSDSFTVEENKQSRSFPASNSYSCTNVGRRQSKDSRTAVNYSSATEESRHLEEDPSSKNFLLDSREVRGDPFVKNHPLGGDVRRQTGNSQISKSYSFLHEEKKQLGTMPCRRSDVFNEQSSRDPPCRKCTAIPSDYGRKLSPNNLPRQIQTHTNHYQKCDTTKRQAFSSTICRECNTIREDKSRRLSLDRLASRTQNRSSQILNWLKNPENQFMFQGKGIDSHIFRSRSAVQNRPNFAKATRCYSLREQVRESRQCVNETSVLFENYNADIDENGHLSDKPNINAGLVYTVDDAEGPETSNECKAPNLDTSGDSGLHKHALREASQGNFIGKSQNALCGETDELLNNSCDSEFFQKQRQDEKERKHRANNLAFKLDSLNLSIGWDSSFQDYQSITSCNSLPNYGTSKREGKLRRINSDALFYKAVFRNSDRRNSFGFRKRQSRLSLKLRDLVDADRVMSSQDTGIDSLESNSRQSCTENIDVNSKEFIDNIEQIVSHGDVLQIRELADFGFDFNVKDRKGNCGLHYAAERGSEKIVTEILENGGSVWVRNSKNQLPVDLASNINVLMLLSGATMFFRGQYKQEIETRLVSKGMSFEL